MANACCPTDVKPVVNNYKGVGKYVTIDGHFDMYITGSGTKAIMQIYDLFGMTPHTEQFADRMADQGFLVVVPDFIGDAWPPSNIPVTKEGKFPKGVEPGDGTEVLFNWIMNHPNCRRDRAESIEAVKQYLVKNYGMEKFGAVGMCWGAKVAWTSARQKEGLVDALASCHGSLMTKEDVENVDVPQCFLNSKDESYDDEIKPVVEAKSPLNVYKNFPKMHHGWMGTRGTGADTDFDKQEIVQGFQEGITDLTNFFHKVL